METKNIVIIGILCIIICIFVGAIFGVLTNNVDYERIEIVPNGTSIEIPTEQAKFEGEVNETGAKLWSFKHGALMAFNSDEAINARGIYGLGGAYGFKSIKDIVLNHFEKIEKTDGYTVYVIDGQKLGIENRGILYCIMVGNETTHDNIIITADSKDIALHMAKSVIYKMGNITANSVDDLSGDTSGSDLNTNGTGFSLKSDDNTGDDSKSNLPQSNYDESDSSSGRSSSDVETSSDSGSSVDSASSSDSGDGESVETTTGLEYSEIFRRNKKQKI